MPDSLQPIEDPNRAIVGAATPAVMAPGHTFDTVTDKISSIVLARRTPRWWSAGFGVMLIGSMVVISRWFLPDRFSTLAGIVRKNDEWSKPCAAKPTPTSFCGGIWLEMSRMAFLKPSVVCSLKVVMRI